MLRRRGTARPRTSRYSGLNSARTPPPPRQRVSRFWRRFPSAPTRPIRPQKAQFTPRRDGKQASLWRCSSSGAFAVRLREIAPIWRNVASTLRICWRTDPVWFAFRVPQPTGNPRPAYRQRGGTCSPEPRDDATIILGFAEPPSTRVSTESVVHRHEKSKIVPPLMFQASTEVRNAQPQRDPQAAYREDHRGH